MYYKRVGSPTFDWAPHMKGTQASPGKLVKPTRAGVSATQAYDLEIEQGIYSQDPYNSKFENNYPNKQESKAFSPFFALFCSQQLTTPHGNEIFWPEGLSATSRKELYHLPGEQGTRGRSRFFIDVPSYLAPARELKCVCGFGRFSAAGSPLRVHQNTS